MSEFQLILFLLEENLNTEFLNQNECFQNTVCTKYFKSKGN